MTTHRLPLAVAAVLRKKPMPTDLLTRPVSVDADRRGAVLGMALRQSVPMSVANDNNRVVMDQKRESNIKANAAKIMAGDKLQPLLSASIAAKSGRVLFLGAGPSLEKVMPHLNELSKGAVVIAADIAALRIADLFDPGSTCYAFSVDADPHGILAERFAGRKMPDNWRLIAQTYAAPEVVNAFQHHMFFAPSVMVSRAAMQGALYDVTLLDTGPTVLNTAFIAAVSAGASETMFAGVDLAYTDGNVTERNPDLVRPYVLLHADGMHRVVPYVSRESERVFTVVLQTQARGFVSEVKRSLVVPDGVGFKVGVSQAGYLSAQNSFIDLFQKSLASRRVKRLAKIGNGILPCASIDVPDLVRWSHGKLQH